MIAARQAAMLPGGPAMFPGAREIEGRDLRRLVLGSVTALVLLNWTWHAWTRRIPGALFLHLAAASLIYFALLRLVLGIRFGDLSARARFVVLTAHLLLVVFLYFGRADTYRQFFEPWVPPSFRAPSLGFAYFAASSVVLRLALPLLLLRFVLRAPPADYGFVVRGGGPFSRVYLGLFLVMVPLVIWASTLPGFQAAYPQARGLVVGQQAPLGLFTAYEAAYFMVFLSGESFWRGYLTFGLGRDLGLAALPWMVMMYSISHYGKPALEVNASIVAGFLLGYLALRHRSFLLGALLHWGVALLMDLSVLHQRGITWR